MGKEVIELFPIRVHDELTKAKPGDKHSYNPAAKEATLPIGISAYERDIRLHEALHAIYSSSRVDETVVAQSCEDMRLHLNHAKLEGQPRRDEIVSALRDLRSIAWAPPVGLYNNKADAGNILGSFLRAVSILRGTEGRYVKLIREAKHNLPKLGIKDHTELGSSLRKATEDILKTDYIARAKKILARHFPDPEQANSGIANPLMAGKCEGAGSGTRVGQELKWESEFGGAESLEKVCGFGSSDALDFLGEHTLERMAEMYHAGTRPVMKHHNLSMTQPRESKDAPGALGTFSGSRIRSKRLAAAMTSPVPIRLFERRRPNMLQGGTVLIDASGSMNLEDRHLKAIADLIPAGTVAYYSAQSHHDGHLVICADKGKQYAFPEGEALPYRCGGNEVDYQALSWLMNQPAPRYFVTDGAFCGGFCEAASVMFENVKQRKLVKQYKSLKGLKNALEKGDIKSHTKGDDDDD